MGFWKKFGMIAGGITAVVLAAPTGGASLAAGLTTMGLGLGVGATAATAAAGAAAGTAVGAMIDKDEREKGRRQGREEQAAQDAQRIKKLEERFQQMYASMHQANEHYQFTTALVAIGMAAANAVGRNSNEDKENILEFVAGVSNVSLPDKVKAIIEKYKCTPPSMHEAITEARKLQSVAPAQFRDVILLALDDEDGTSSAGKKFLEAWNREFA